MLAYAFIIVIDIIVLGLSASLNVYQEFFFTADIFPLVLSVVTLVVLLLHIGFDLAFQNAFTARPAFEVPSLATLTALWLVSDSFSTSRYINLPDCSIFTDGLDGEQVWCRNAQALRAMMWIEWLALLVTTLVITRMAIVQARRGNTAVWHTALSRYRRNNQSRDFLQDASSFYRGSSIFGFDRTNSHQKNSSRDWFAPAEPVIRLSDNVDSQKDSAAGSFFGASTTGLGTFGGETQSAVPLQQQFQFQTPRSTKTTAVTKTVDGFEIVSTGHYFQSEGIWSKNGPQWKS